MPLNLTNRQITLAQTLAERMQKEELDESFHAVWGTGLSPGQKPILVWGEGEWDVLNYSFGDFNALAEEGLIRMTMDSKYPFPKGVTGYAPTDEHYSCTATAQLFTVDNAAPTETGTANPDTGGTAPYILEVFISHSSVDADLAELLIRLIRDALDVPQHEIRCTSVDGYRLRTGVSTDDQIKREVRHSRCFIALLTPSSLTSSYVLFELGARWGTQLPLFPILARGTTPSDLWAPLSSLNAVSCYTASQIHQIIADLGSVVGRQLNAPATYEKCVQQLLESAAEPAVSDVPPATGDPPDAQHKGESATVSGSPAKELLDLILSEADPEKRGIVEIGASLEPGKTYFFPRIQYAGTPLSIKSRHFREAISELLEGKRLYPAEHNERTNTETYEYRADSN